MNHNRGSNYTGEPSYSITDALKLPILFYTIDWTPEKKAEWLRITGTSEATTKVMCDHLRSALAIANSKNSTIELIAELDDWAARKPGEGPFNNWGPALTRLLAEASGELNRYRVWVDDLQAETFVNCVYCGHRYGPGETTPVTMADALKAHVAECPKHPMSALLASVKELTQHIVHYEEGDLTREEFSAMCARADAAIDAVKP
jgi:hypothetical protein